MGRRAPTHLSGVPEAGRRPESRWHRNSLLRGKWTGVFSAWTPDGELRMPDQFQSLGMGEQRVPVNSDCSCAPGLQESSSPPQGLELGRYLNNWTDGCVGWLASIGDPSIIRTQESPYNFPFFRNSGKKRYIYIQCLLLVRC